MISDYFSFFFFSFFFLRTAAQTKIGTLRHEFVQFFFFQKSVRLIFQFHHLTIPGSLNSSAVEFKTQSQRDKANERSSTVAVTATTSSLCGTGSNLFCSSQCSSIVFYHSSSHTQTHYLIFYLQSSPVHPC